MDQFLGKWLEVKKEGFQHLADALGLTGETRAFFENSRSELVYSRNGDSWTIQVGVVGSPKLSSYTFKFGEPYLSNNIDGSPLKGVVRQEGSRLVERHESIGPNQFVMDIVREVQGDIMRSWTSVGGVSVETTFRRA